jgi:uncharacterized membrane protein
MRNIVIIAMCLLAIDGIYLYSTGKWFLKMIQSVQGKQISLRYLGIILCYILLPIGLYYFIVLPRRPIWEAFLLGVVIYGVYDTTNYATLSGWKWNLALLDTIWGGILFSLTTAIVYRLV